MSRAASSVGLWRLAAIALLLCGGFDILVVDTALWNPRGAAACCDDSPASDDCFCCCSHIVVVPAISIAPIRIVTAFVEETAVIPASAPAPVAELPPRA